MLTALRIFVDLVDARSFSGAAARNYLTPSAVSQRIKLLEQELGQELVVRSRGGLTTTQAGDLFYQASRDILDRHDRVREELDRLRGVVSGRIRVGTVTSVGLHELPPYIKVFLKRYPEVDLAIDYMANPDIYRELATGALDLGIVAFPDRSQRFVTVPFRHDELVAIVPPEHPLAKLHTLTLRRLDGEPFIAFDEAMPTGRVVEKQLKQSGVGVKVVHRFDNVETIKRAVEIGSGLAIVPAKTVEQEIANGTLKGIEIRGAGWRRPIAAVRKRDRDPSPATLKFLDVLRSEP